MALLLGICLPSCKQEIDYPYQGKDGIHFKHYTLDYNRKRVYYDVYGQDSGRDILGHTYSMGFLPDDVEQDTIKIPVELLGRVSDAERTYRVEVVAELTNAVEGMYYEPFSAEQKFAAAAISDTLRIVINRNSLSTSFRNPQDVILTLRIVPSDDFDTGLAGGVEMIFALANYLTEPTWWNSAEGNWQGALDYYHPLKWKILISFDPDFASYDSSPYDTNTGRNYVDGLVAYMNSNLVIDEETNERLFMYYAEPYNP
jgi:hypothetical protein